MMRLVTDESDFDADTANDSTMSIAPAVAEPDALADEWPAEVDLILSAMDAAAARPSENRRAAERRPHRSRAELRLYATDPEAPAMALFTRDISATGVGFITQQRLPLGYNGSVRITLDGDRVVTASCSVYRCRQSIDGWYEGALHFTNRQAELG